MTIPQDPDKEAAPAASLSASKPSPQATLDKFDFTLDPATFGMESDLAIRPNHTESVADLMSKPRDTPVKPLRPVEGPAGDRPSPLRPQRHELMSPNTPGFAIYQYGKYPIDIPVPEPDRYRIARLPLSLYFRTFFISMAGIFLTLLLFFLYMATSITFLGISTIVCVFLTFIAIVMSYPDLIPPRHATPFEAASTLRHLYRTRAIFAASRIISSPAESEGDQALHPLWYDSLPTWSKAMSARFTNYPLPRLHLAAGDDAHAAIVLIEEARAYYLVPVVHLKDGWYVTDPAMKPHKMPKASL